MVKVKGDRIHRVSTTLPNVTNAISTGISGATYLLDLASSLSDDLGRNLPVCAVYDVTRITIELNPQGTADEDQGMVLVGNVAWIPPTGRVVAAMKWAAKEFFAERKADYANQRSLQWYPKIGPFADPVSEARFSKRDDDGKIYALTGATDATYYGVFDDWALQHPVSTPAAARPGAQVQTTRLYDEPLVQDLQSMANVQVGYGIGVHERFANNSTGPEDAATPFLTVASEDPAVWVHHSRMPVGFWPWDLCAGPGRSYPVTCGQLLITWESAWPIRKTGMWGGNEVATPRVDVEVVGWHELR